MPLIAIITLLTIMKTLTPRLDGTSWSKKKTKSTVSLGQVES
jgi:hypothetical protein